MPQLLLGGSTSPAEDLSTFLKKSPNLLVSTPGRLLELLTSPHVHCPQSSFEMLVLDEGDRLLDLGFKDELQKILRCLPKQRRTGLFSASVSEAVDQLVRVGLRNPVKVNVKVKGSSGALDKRTPASLQMTYLTTPPAQKFLALNHILSTVHPTPQKTICFVSTCSAVDYLSAILPPTLAKTDSDSDITLIPLHGKHPANVRQKNFTRFITSTTPAILLTTDVASRGLDIPAVDLVIQIDPPSDPKTFIHRCGRAGRAGRRGLSVVLLHPGREEDYVSFLDVRKTPVTAFPHALSASSGDPDESITRTRDLVLTDRALHDRGQKAFVSWLRSYSKHQASSIFRVADLDWEALGKAWGLLKLPKMPELRHFSGDRTLGLPELDWENYAYKDKQREKRRRAAAREAVESGGDASGEQNGKKRRAGESVAWSQQTDNREKKLRRKEQKKTRKDKSRWDGMTESERQKALETERMVEELRAKNERQRSSKPAPNGQAAGGNEEEEFQGFD